MSLETELPVILQQMLDEGFAVKRPDGKFDLTPKGIQEFKEMVASDPKFYANAFPDWVRKEWLH